LVRSGRLVADDVIELESTHEGLVGSAPKSLFGLLELSRAGIIDVRRVFGPSMIRRTAPVDIIISLEESPDALSAAPQITQNHHSLMGFSIPMIHLGEGISGDAVMASIAEYIMIEAGALSPILDALVK
jgi:serine kinase of HPr protein (carbohydrate metabolism regulator)